MQKTPDQIYDEVEARWVNSIAAKKSRTKRRVGEVATLAGPVVMCLYWSIGSHHDSTGIVIASAFSALAWFELGKRWALEDRVDALENSKK